MNLQTPAVLQAEHEELHGDLARATEAGGRTGEAAMEVAKLMHAHFIKEEAYALPLLGLLPVLAEGKLGPEMTGVIEMIDKLEVEMPQMLAEHKTILAALERLVDAAKAEAKWRNVLCAEKVMAHVRAEEELSYPTALLIGRYLKAVLPGSKSKAT